MSKNTKYIKKELINWYEKNGRVLPWRQKFQAKPINSYQVLISEIMLQQTTVPHVIKKYSEFMKLWPSCNKLSKASENQVLKFWSGLGYYNRGINLLKSAKIISKKFHGKVPDTKKDLLSLPGIGNYTALAILAIAYNKPVMPIDANIERIIARIYGLNENIKRIKTQIEEFSEAFIYKNRSGDMAQALMDFGSLVCKPRNPQCNICFIQSKCLAYKKNLTNVIPLKDKLSSKLKPKKYACAYLTIDNDKILLRKRSSKGMLPSMLEVPTSDWVKRPLTKKQIEEYSPVKLKYKKMNKKIKYQFSHFTLFLDLFISHTKRKKLVNYYWYSIKNFESLKMPTLMKLVIRSYLS